MKPLACVDMLKFRPKNYPNYGESHTVVMLASKAIAQIDVFM